MCEIILMDLDGTSCEPEGGISATVLIAPVKDFTVIGEPPPTLEDYETLGELATVSAAHTFPVGKGFSQIESIQEISTLKCTGIGETERKLYQNEAMFKVSGSKADVLGFMRLVKNGRFIVLMEEAGSGNLRQIGTKLKPARFTAIESNIEAAAEGDNSVTFTIQDKQKWPAPIYPAAFTVTLKPAA